MPQGCTIANLIMKKCKALWVKPDTYLWNLWKKDILVWRSHNRIQHSLCFLHMRKVAVWLFVYLYGAEADISGYVAMLPMYLSGILRVTWNMWFLFLSWYVLFTRWVDPFTQWDREGFDYFCIFTEDSKAQKSEPANDFCWNFFLDFFVRKSSNCCWVRKSEPKCYLRGRL